MVHNSKCEITGVLEITEEFTRVRRQTCCEPLTR